MENYIKEALEEFEQALLQKNQAEFEKAEQKLIKIISEKMSHAIRPLNGITAPFIIASLKDYISEISKMFPKSEKTADKLRKTYKYDRYVDGIKTK